MFKDPDIGKPAEQLRGERKKRLNDAADCKVPDRVPVTCYIGYFAAKYAGILNSAAFYDFDAWYDANEKRLRIFARIPSEPCRSNPAGSWKYQIRWPIFGRAKTARRMPVINGCSTKA